MAHEHLDSFDRIYIRIKRPNSRAIICNDTLAGAKLSLMPSLNSLVHVSHMHIFRGKGCSLRTNSIFFRHVHSCYSRILNLIADLDQIVTQLLDGVGSSSGLHSLGVVCYENGLGSLHNDNALSSLYPSIVSDKLKSFAESGRRVCPATWLSTHTFLP